MCKFFEAFNFCASRFTSLFIEKGDEIAMATNYTQKLLSASIALFSIMLHELRKFCLG